MAAPDDNDRIAAELAAAETARAQRNEGKARVCARRAAGIIARVYFTRRNTSLVSGNAYELLGMLENDAELPETLRISAQRLRTRVNEMHELPEQFDLIEEARGLIDALENILNANH
jgi:hypothetical protein